MVVGAAGRGDLFTSIAGIVLIPFFFYMAILLYGISEFDYKLILFRDFIRIEYRSSHGIVHDDYPLDNLEIEKPRRNGKPYKLINSDNGNTFKITFNEMIPVFGNLHSLCTDVQWKKINKTQFFPDE